MSTFTRKAAKRLSKVKPEFTKNTIDKIGSRFALKAKFKFIETSTINM